MDTPAEIHRALGLEEAEERGVWEVVVARGPLVIMAHGLVAIDPDGDAGCWITSAEGSLTPRQASAALLDWERPPRRLVAS
ncbi:hypothetical protein [Sphingomonas sp.]|uniref:hypothetical protein n=1 Tax=Sphingomonas sp. TaxID=28214 RepID=UPI001B1D9B68|nr:hypothetical protein [Sphingomonas sp.]MBO9711418.1 hypothetical protein [Sphingomonas sp.]